MIRHFKLIKQYPDSGCNLGDVITFANPNDVVIFNPIENCEYFYNLKECEKYPEFWKEIKPLCQTEDGKNVYFGDSVHWIVYSQTCPNYAYKLSFVDLHLQLDFVNKYKIFSTKESAEEYIKKNTIRFKTEDGVSIKDGDSWWYIQTGEYNGTNGMISMYPWKVKPSNTGTLDLTATNIKRFSTEESAKTWLKWNKPKYSLQDIKNASVYFPDGKGNVIINLSILEYGNK